MSYPMSLDEYSDERIIEEYDRRMKCLVNDQCYYCGRDINDGKACKISGHQPGGYNEGE